MNPCYRTIIAGDLVQESALSVGGNQPHGLVDMPLARDGRGRPVLRGSALAGAFIDTARRILGRNIPDVISHAGTDEKHTGPSRWRFEHSHPRGTVATVFHQHVSIDQRTGASADDQLYNLEAVPRGQRWAFCMEVAPRTGDDSVAVRGMEALVVPVLHEWSRPGGCRLGRGGRHGYGWLHLDNVRIWRLTREHAPQWPNAELDIHDTTALANYFAAHRIESLDVAAYAGLMQGAVAELGCKPATVIDLAGMLVAGEREDEFGAGYGLDSLSVGGHARLANQTSRWHGRVNQPRGISLNVEEFEPDFVITADERPDGTLEPYVPGASLRGVWRSAMSCGLRAQGVDVRNPGGPNRFAGSGIMNLVDRLFGDTGRAGLLSLADAHLADNDWLLAWQQHVAIDELTGGAFESHKFDRLALLRARFGWRARIDTIDAGEAAELAAHIQELLSALGNTRHLPVGGGQWRGHGHIQWELKETSTRKLGDPS